MLCGWLVESSQESPTEMALTFWLEGGRLRLPLLLWNSSLTSCCYYCWAFWLALMVLGLPVMLVE